MNPAARRCKPSHARRPRNGFQPFPTNSETKIGSKPQVCDIRTYAITYCRLPLLVKATVQVCRFTANCTGNTKHRKGPHGTEKDLKKDRTRPHMTTRDRKAEGPRRSFWRSFAVFSSTATALSSTSLQNVRYYVACMVDCNELS